MNPELPTRIGDVEPWLRALANGRDVETGGYAYLFGMATVKLAEAHAEIVRLRANVAETRERLDAMENVAMEQSR